MVPSLINLTRDYVIDHICSVESLWGLPETIGEWLFSRFLERYYVNGDRCKLAHGLNVFVDAYAHLVISKLNLCRSLVIINEFTDCLLPLITNTTELDLSHCQLGEEHEVLQHLTNVANLRKLSFRNCAVNDDLLRRLTIPCRVFKKGILNLEELDLSCNSKITDRSLSYLGCLRRLQVLIMSGTSVSTTAAKTFATKLDLVVIGDLQWKPITNEGWAKGLIEFWTNQENVTTSSRRSRIDRYDISPTKYFYSHQKARLKLVQELKSSKEPSELPAIAFVRYPRHIDRPSKLSSSLVATFDTINDDLMKSYLEHEMTKPNCSRNLLQTLNMLEK